MNTSRPLRNPRDVIHDMLMSITPERVTELDRYWDEFGVQFHILDDDGPDGPVVLDAGGYVSIRFNHRMMRLFWLGSFAMWEGFSAFHHYATTQEADLARFGEILDCFEATRAATNVDAVPWPAYLPLPGELVDHTPGDPARVGGELAIFGVGWAFLHELQHLIRQQKGTSAAWNDVEACRREEHSCDAFATTFFLERIAELAAATGQSASGISDKRQMGIYCAVFTMVLLSRRNWEPSERHPGLQERIDAIAKLLEAHGTSKVAAVVAVAAFASLKLAHPDAPDPFATVNLVARRAGWDPDHPLSEE